MLYSRLKRGREAKDVEEIGYPEDGEYAGGVTDGVAVEKIYPGRVSGLKADLRVFLTIPAVSCGDEGRLGLPAAYVI